WFFELELAALPAIVYMVIMIMHRASLTMLPALSLLATLGCGDPDDADTNMIDGVPSSTVPTPGTSTVAPNNSVSPVSPGTTPSSVEPVAPAPGGACPALDADGI